MLLAFKDPSRPAPPHPDRHPQRRLSDKIRAAFCAACDEGAAGIAAQLLVHLESLITYPPNLPAGADRRAREILPERYPPISRGTLGRS